MRIFDVVPRDWSTQDAETIAKRTLEDVSQGSIILLHDGGGARQGTIEATDIIIQNLKGRHYRIVTVGELLRYSTK